MATKPNESKGLPVPLSFAVAVILILALFVFFGAWAVSADSDSHNRTLSLAFAGPNATLLSEDTGDSPSEARAYRLDSTEESSTADTWWGKSFLTACPLH